MLTEEWGPCGVVCTRAHMHTNMYVCLCGCVVLVCAVRPLGNEMLSELSLQNLHFGFPRKC